MTFAGASQMIRPMATAKVTRRFSRACHQQLIDFFRARKGAPRPQGPTVQRSDGVGVAQDILDVAVRRSQARRGERAAKGVAGAGAVDTVNRVRRRADLAAGNPGKTAFPPERYADKRRAEF